LQQGCWYYYKYKYKYCKYNYNQVPRHNCCDWSRQALHGQWC